MQTFSYMQRSGNDETSIKNLLKILFYLFFVFLYEPLTTIYIYLPPFFGFLFWYFYTQSTKEKIFVLTYLYLYEIDHALSSFSLIIALFVTLYFVKKLQKFLLCGYCLKMSAIILFYFFIGVVQILVYILFQTKLTLDISLLLYYIVWDAVAIIYAK